MEAKSAYEELYEAVDNEIDNTARVHFNVMIGRGNVICEGVIIREGVQIGDNNFIGPYCIIGDVAEKFGFFDKPGKVVIGSGNRFTKQCTIDASTNDVTIIKNNVTMLKNAHVGHDAKIESNCVISCNAVVGGHTELGEGCNVGLGAVIHQRIKVPPNNMIGMNTTVTKKTVMRPGRKLVGSPARDIGPNER